MQRSFVCCCGRAISVTSCGYCARGEVLKALGWASTTSKKGCWCPACIVRTGYPLPDKRSARVCTSCGQTCSELEHAAYQASESQTPIVSAIPAASPSELCAPLFDEYSLPFEAGDTYMGICPLPRDIGGYFFHGRIGNTKLVETQFLHFACESMRCYTTRLIPLRGDSAAHNLCCISPDFWPVVAKELGDEGTYAYAIGGQYYGAHHKRFRQSLANAYAGVSVYSLDTSSYTWERRRILFTGDWPSCVEMRPKCGGAGEFDGQSSLVHFNGRWFAYTRANANPTYPHQGFRAVQVTTGRTLASFGAFALVEFAGIPVSANIYFAHMYICPGQGFRLRQLSF